MKQLFLDTDTIHKEGFFSERMQSIKRLVKSKNLTIHMAEISKREFISKCIFDITEKLDIAIKNMDPKFFSESCLKKCNKEIEIIIKHIEESLKINFEHWRQLLNIDVMSFHPKDIVKVMDDYFKGNGVFYLSPKNRKHIPDAMINTSIKDLLNKYNELVVITNDIYFREYLEKNSQIKVFNSLKDFLKEKDIKQIIDDLEYKENPLVKKVKEYFVGDNFHDFLIQYLIESKETIEGICLTGRQVFNTTPPNQIIPTSQISRTEQTQLFCFLDVEVKYPISNEIKNMHIVEVVMSSKNKYTIKLEFETIAFVDKDYFTHRDLFSLEEWYVRLYGEVQIETKEEFSLDYLKKHCSKFKQSDNTFTLNLEVNRVDLVQRSS